MVTKGMPLYAGPNSISNFRPERRDRRRVGSSHCADGFAGIEQAGIEKIRTFAARFQA